MFTFSTQSDSASSATPSNVCECAFDVLVCINICKLTWSRRKRLIAFYVCCRTSHILHIISVRNRPNETKTTKLCVGKMPNVTPVERFNIVHSTSLFQFGRFVHIPYNINNNNKNDWRMNGSIAQQQQNGQIFICRSLATDGTLEMLLWGNFCTQNENTIEWYIIIITTLRIKSHRKICIFKQNAREHRNKLHRNKQKPTKKCSFSFYGKK